MRPGGDTREKEAGPYLEDGTICLPQEAQPRGEDLALYALLFNFISKRGHLLVHLALGRTAKRESAKKTR